MIKIAVANWVDHFDHQFEFPFSVWFFAKW